MGRTIPSFRIASAMEERVGGFSKPPWENRAAIEDELKDGIMSHQAGEPALVICYTYRTQQGQSNRSSFILEPIICVAVSIVGKIKIKFPFSISIIVMVPFAILILSQSVAHDTSAKLTNDQSLIGSFSVPSSKAFDSIMKYTKSSLISGSALNKTTKDLSRESSAS